MEEPDVSLSEYFRPTRKRDFGEEETAFGRWLVKDPDCEIAAKIDLQFLKNNLAG